MELEVVVSMVGIEGETEMEGTSGKTEMLGTSSKLIVGMDGVSLTWMGGVSETLIVGTTGADEVEAGIYGLYEAVGGPVVDSRLEGRFELSSLSSTSRGFQPGAKLTIGRPGRSLTTVGLGSLGLLSFNRMLVAARISSLRISIPFLVTNLSSSLTAVGS